MRQPYKKGHCVLLKTSRNSKVSKYVEKICAMFVRTIPGYLVDFEGYFGFMQLSKECHFRGTIEKGCVNFLT